MRAFLILAALCLAGCGGGVAPPDVYLTLSVSTADIAVETSINGKRDDFLSGASGSMVASGPVNAKLRNGANEISFALSRAEDVGGAFEPSLIASLEISRKGETVDTLRAGERVIFLRELNETEIGELEAGAAIVVTETFDISRDRLEAIMAAGES